MWMLLHGFTGSPRSWDTVVERASLAERPLTPTLFGHSPDWRDLSVVSFDDEVARLCDEASRIAAPRFVAGYSLGARLAAGMIARAPASFSGALLIGVHPGLTDAAEKQARRKTDAERASFLRDEGIRAFVDAWEREPIFETQRHLSPAAVAEQRAVRLQHDPEGLARSLEVLGLAEMAPTAMALAEAGIPISLMTGSEDMKFTALAADLAASSECLETLIVEGAGHNLLLERSDAVAAALEHVQARATEKAP
jgi:2-succinyl-6-hydroxy-2,4-cyclohexadiene-1-carboxylate synthase